MITGENFLSMLANDPALVIKTVTANNPKAVTGNIIAARLNSPNAQLNDPQTILMNLYTRGKYDQVAKILSVPYLPNMLPPGYDDFFREVVQLKPTEKMMMRSDTGTSENNWWVNMDWSGIINSIGDVYTQIAGGNPTTLQDNQLQPLPPAPVDNTMLYVGVGAAALIVALLLYLALKK